MLQTSKNTDVYLVELELLGIYRNKIEHLNPSVVFTIGSNRHMMVIFVVVG